MKLKKLIKELPGIIVRGPKEVVITGICANSKVAAPGNLFIAKKGITTHGAQYVSEAIEGGAVAVLTDIYDPMFSAVTQLIHPNPSEIEAHINEVYHNFPSRSLYMVGITGTNGKTTVAYLAKHLMDGLLGPCGLIGTVEYIVGDHSFPATRTTPDVTTNNKLLHEMVIRGCRSAVMEVTSHALHQGRVKTIDYDAAIFTNLSQDHLDYHHSMEEYCKAKRNLFITLDDSKTKKGKVAIINQDDPWASKIVEGCKAKIITYGIESDADVVASNIIFDEGRTRFTLKYQGKEILCESPFAGRFNVYNVLAVTALAITKGFTLERLMQWIPTLPPVPGRLEPVSNNVGLKVFVDFAHTDDALRNVLKTVLEMKPHKLITVFGCGGDRDRSKRAVMAGVVAELSDLAIVTSDNPRSEDPSAIVKDILEGFPEGTNYEVFVDRREAIKRALEVATPDDIVLIAGKGHERQQVYAHRTIEFDDKTVAEELCNTLITA